VVTRRVKAVVTRWVRGESELALDAEIALSRRDFGLEAPVAMGFIRVDPKVRVVVDVELAAKNGAAAANGAQTH